MKVTLSFHDCHRRGGVERILVECANFLASRGHQVRVLSAHFEENVLEANIIASRVPTSFPRLPTYIRSATKFLKDDPPDVHATFGAVCPAGGISWVQSVHAAWLNISRKNRRLAGRIKQRLNPFHPYILHRERAFFGRRQYRRLIALTQDVKRDLMHYYNVPADDIDLLPNGFSPEEFNPRQRDLHRQSVRQQLGFSDSDKVILWIANEVDRKGLIPLLHALSQIKDPTIKLLTVGRIDLPSLSPFSLNGRVTHVAPTSQVAKYYAAADVFCLPTIYEAWGLVIVEALASGLPVLTSRLAGASVAVQEDQTGLLLDNPRDANEIRGKLQHLLTFPSSPESISATVANYAWPNILTRYEQILQSCV